MKPLRHKFDRFILSAHGLQW